MSSMYFPTRQRDVPIRLVLICMIMYAITAEGLQFVSLTHKLPPGDFTMDTNSYSSPGLFYGTCSKNPFDANNYDCTFAMETNSKIGSLEHLRFCNFTFSTASDLDPGFSVYSIEEDKAILYTADIISRNISILHFSDCREVPLSLDNMKLRKIYPAHHGIFDVVAWSDDEKMAFRTVRDFEGNLITGNQRIHLPYPEMSIQSPLKMRLIVSEDFNEKEEVVIQVAAINYDGSTEVLRVYPLSRYHHSLDKYATSTTHELLSVCTEKNFRVFCGQFDLNGVMKFDIDFPLFKSSSEYVFKPFNLPGGGLLVLLFKCSGGEITVGHCIKHTDDYYVVKKFDNAGRLVGSLQLRQFPEYYFSPVSRFHFFVNENKEMCLSALNTRQQPLKNQVTLDVACFNDKDLFL